MKPAVSFSSYSCQEEVAGYLRVRVCGSAKLNGFVLSARVLHVGFPESEPCSHRVWDVRLPELIPRQRRPADCSL